VKYYYLDCANLREKKETHEYLAAVFSFPLYYGKNLDALYDCLTELGNCEITLENTDLLDTDYAQRVHDVFLDAEHNNPHLVLHEEPGTIGV